MPTLLDEHLVADSLTALTDWSGDTSRIARTVALPPDQIEELVAEVAVAADALDHHPVVDRESSSATFTLWTHSEGGVTELDIALASRIDDLVLKASGEGVPGEQGTATIAGAPTAEGMGAGEHGTGRRQDGSRRTDEDVIDEESESAARGGNSDRGEPWVGVPAANAGSPTTGVAVPDDAPDEPEPGLARP